MELELTNEQKIKSVLAAYDSVNLINELKSKETLTEDEILTLNRNEEHIKIMLTKDWFVDTLTPNQLTELQLI
jgi:hypothetical protein